ncbi:hypothetical protein [Kribbella monticola]|uniref:hypothetical protein n=1 Tax=Kribbella monticola TaxID=2185285 RepID=UPI000DD2D2F0|nr:hypothetical protein [Kribbella monticola]
MSWQLWVLVGLAVTGAIGLFAWKLRHAQEVFDRIVRQTDPVGQTDPVAQADPVRQAVPPVDEVARRRLARTPAPRRVVGHLPHIAVHSRRHH